MAVMHLPIKFCTNTSIQFGVIHNLRILTRRAPPSWIFKSCTFGPFRHVNNVVLKLYIKFGLNICESLRSTHVCFRHSCDDVTQINFRFGLLVTWSSPQGPGASSHIICCKISVITLFKVNISSKFQMAAVTVFDLQFMWIWPFRPCW